MTGLVFGVALGTLAFWFFGFVVCLAGGIAFVIAGIMIAVYRKTPAISKLRKPKCISALCIIIGAMMIPFSFGILFPFLDFIRDIDFSDGYDFLNKSLGKLESASEIFLPIFELTSEIVFGFFCCRFSGSHRAVLGQRHTNCDKAQVH